MILEGKPTQPCPVLIEAEHVLDATHDLGKAMRRFRRKLRLCRECDQEGACPAIQYFQVQIRTAIAELSEDWMP